MREIITEYRLNSVRFSSALNLSDSYRPVLFCYSHFCLRFRFSFFRVFFFFNIVVHLSCSTFQRYKQHVFSLLCFYFFNIKYVYIFGVPSMYAFRKHMNKKRDFTSFKSYMYLFMVHGWIEVDGCRAGIFCYMFNVQCSCFIY